MCGCVSSRVNQDIVNSNKMLVGVIKVSQAARSPLFGGILGGQVKGTELCCSWVHVSKNLL